MSQENISSKLKNSLTSSRKSHEGDFCNPTQELDLINETLWIKIHGKRYKSVDELINDIENS